MPQRIKVFAVSNTGELFEDFCPVIDGYAVSKRLNLRVRADHLTPYYRHMGPHRTPTLVGYVLGETGMTKGPTEDSTYSAENEGDWWEGTDAGAELEGHVTNRRLQFVILGIAACFLLGCLLLAGMQVGKEEPLPGAGPGTDPGSATVPAPRTVAPRRKAHARAAKAEAGKRQPNTRERMAELVDTSWQDANNAPFQRHMAYTDPWSVKRHRDRSVQLTGGGAAAALPLKIGGLVGLVMIPVGVLLFSPETPWLLDLVIGAFLVVLIVYFGYIYGAWADGFLRVLVTERDNFTMPFLITGLCELNLPRGCFADKPHLWSGHGGRGGMSSPKAYLWLTLPEGKLITDLWDASDYRGLERDPHRMNRRSVQQRLQWWMFSKRSRRKFDEWKSGGELIKQSWPYIMAGIMVGAGILLVILTSG